MLKQIEPIGTMAIVIGCLASTVFAQGGNAVINGTVFDQAKAVLPGVTVTVTNEATGISREALSGPEGHFVVPTLLPGTYTIRTTLDRFSGPDTRRRRVAHRSGTDARSHDVRRRSAEQVVVTAEAPIIETTASRIGVGRLRAGDRSATQPGAQSSFVDATRAGSRSRTDAGRVRGRQLQRERAHYCQQPVDG